MAFFDYSIDNKPIIKDKKGNEIVDLTKSIFGKDTTANVDYTSYAISDKFSMRPDLVSIAHYGIDSGTEMILKWTGISNPFSIDKDDIMRIPNYESALAAFKTDADEIDDDAETRSQEIKNYYKYVNKNYDGDMSSYKNVLNKEIPTGNINVSDTRNYTVPYINTGDGASITIRNGKVYFGENAGVTSAAVVEGTLTVEDLDQKIKDIIDSTATTLSDQCLYNGISTSNFVRASNNSQ